MEQVGIKLEFDSLGRICIPKKIRNLYGLDSEVELLLSDEGVWLRSPRYTLVEREEQT
ncbi:MAG: hypothetical protein IJY16_09790 [Clostridia bacterium]|nr:hypothetical protein [Clostridia bacterium]